MVKRELDMAVEDSRRWHRDSAQVCRARARTALASGGGQSLDEWVVHRGIGSRSRRLVRHGVPGSNNGGIGRIRSTEVMGRAGQRRGRDGSWIVLRDRVGDSHVVKWQGLRIVGEHKPVNYAYY